MLSGDLFGHNVIKGYWEPLTNNIIRANSYTQPPKKGNYRPIKFYDANINEGLELHIVCDSTGESLPGVNILEFTVSDSSGELGTVTDSNGIAYLNQPGLLRIELQYIGFYDRTFDLKEIKNSGIEISMIEDINFNDIFITNEIWEIKGNKLFFINDNYLDEEPLELRKKHPNSRINVN